MCGITGFIDDPAAGERVQRALAVLAPRGRDGAGICTRSSAPEGAATHAANLWTCVTGDVPASLAAPATGTRAAFGHALHAMIGCVPQPLCGHASVLVANCEIYNWRELAEHAGITVRNDAELLLRLLDEQPILDVHSLAAVCERLDGVYAFAYYRDGRVALARDLLGVKPLWYSLESGLAFASEPRALRAAGIDRVTELHPRTLVVWEEHTHALHESHRAFPSTEPLLSDSYDALLARVSELLRTAVSKRVPESLTRPFGILFSDGVDSATIAAILAPIHPKPRCYIVGEEASASVLRAQRTAEAFDLPLTVVAPTRERVTASLPAVLETIDDANPVKASIALTMWLASEAAARDGCTCLFSGYGADELFSALDRHELSTDLSKESVASLRKAHERDLFRDDAITMRHGIELRLPYLDRALVAYGLRLPESAKRSGSVREGDAVTLASDKRVLRDAARALGVPARVAAEPRKAPQYSSGTLRTMQRLAHTARAPTLAAWLAAQRGKSNKRLAVLLSGGKDSVLALHIMHRMRYEISCAITIESDNPDSYLYHTPNTQIVTLQAESLRVPLITARTSGQPELELAALREALVRAKHEHHIEGVVTGAIGSHYQRERIERLADELGLTVFSPLWQMDQLDALRRLVREGFQVIFTKVAAEGLDASWLGERLTEARIERLAALRRTSGVHPAGEGGEYESFVTDAPLFHDRIRIGRTEVIKDGMAATLRVHDATRQPKTGFTEPPSERDE